MERRDFLKRVTAAGALPLLDRDYLYAKEAIRSGKIETRVYRKKKFHAKAYITHSNLKVVGSSALVGSSNFTFPGLPVNSPGHMTRGPASSRNEFPIG